MSGLYSAYISFIQLQLKNSKMTTNFVVFFKLIIYII